MKAKSTTHMTQAMMMKRHFTAEAVSSHHHENLVKETIKKMMMDREHNILEVVNPIEDEELDNSFQQFQNILQEAELCIADLKEAGDEFEEELKCAEGSVEIAFNACVDLLDDLRRAGEEQLQRYSDERHQNALRLKQLRRQMDEIVQNR
eukprot:CAMPEP_0117021880 /NCGR_PEP_ID=MMETSP0472-20121206/16483_1 /TAXON_ID=693140 ORGANISM="Tiarina fusus, Strain LIS" /NCGR_SAMPLE_ID=MMETSP0472 /ASSEMBLY_ACC=CAM_ASM_000603 /LENGTH=149 /DNA_ID=CAMNT_0004727537 /DNA_START=198 /DNA_END=647 /DNA_ORIENTATION=+